MTEKNKPIAVKKLMENLEFAGPSLGKIPPKASCRVASRVRSINLPKPECSVSSFNKTLLLVDKKLNNLKEWSFVYLPEMTRFR